LDLQIVIVNVGFLVGDAQRSFVTALVISEIPTMAARSAGKIIRSAPESKSAKYGLSVFCDLPKR